MKKMIALIMTLCLLMTAFAAAAETVQPQAVQTADARPVLQDEQAPALVIREVEVKVDDKVEIKRIAATICDASGKVLAEILDDGSFVLTDVHHRESADSRLGHAYDQLMHDVHFSDVEAVQPEEELKAEAAEEATEEVAEEAAEEAAEDVKKLKEDIMERLEESEQIVYDLFIYELFDVMLSNPETAALLADGAYVEFTVELTEEETAPLMIAFSEDGEKWELLDSWKANGRQVTLCMEKQGVVVLIKPYEPAPRYIYNYTQEAVYGPASSSEGEDIFTPSVSSKPAPEVVPTITGDNQIVVGYISTLESVEPAALTLSDYLLITPVAESPYVEDITIHEHLQWAYDAILEAGEVQNLQIDLDRTVIEQPAETEKVAAEESAEAEEPVAEQLAETEETAAEKTEQPEITLGDVIDQQLLKGGFEQTHADLVMRDLFDVTLYGEYVEMFYEPETLLALTFEETEVESGKPLVVLHSHDSISWHVVPMEQVRVNNNGTVTLKLDGMGVVAFMVEKPEVLPEAELAVTSPE